MTNPFTIAAQKLSTAKLRRDATKLEAVRDELARRDDEAAHAEEKAEAEALAKKNAATVEALHVDLRTTVVELAEKTTVLDTHLRGLDAYTEREALLVRAAGIVSELRMMGVSVPDPEHPRLSEAAIKTAEAVWTPLGISLGVAVTARPLLTFR